MLLYQCIGKAKHPICHPYTESANKLSISYANIYCRTNLRYSIWQIEGTNPARVAH